MSYNNVEIFKNAQVNIKKNKITCINNTVQIANISRIWTGRIYNKSIKRISAIFILGLAVIGAGIAYNLLLFLIGAVITLGINLYYEFSYKAKYSGLNIKMCSGEIISFISENENFVRKVYQLLLDIIGGDDITPDYDISFMKYEENIIQNNEIIENIEEIEEEINEEKEKSSDQDSGLEIKSLENEELSKDLNKLYSAYIEKKERTEEILELIDHTIQMIKENNGEELKENYSRLITLGMINDCNNLGLNVLIDEMKRNIY